MFAVDQHGRVVAHTGYEQASGMEDFELGGYPVVADALHGYVRDDTLVLAESHADRLTAWTITDSGELVDRRVWADLGPGSAPDGLCADAEGAIWYASVPGQQVYQDVLLETSNRLDVDRSALPEYVIPQDGVEYFDDSTEEFRLTGRRQAVDAIVEMLGGQ